MPSFSDHNARNFQHAVLLLAILPRSVSAAFTLLNTKMAQPVSLMRRADPEYAQCNFTFPIYDYVEFEANPDIVCNHLHVALDRKLTLGCRQESGWVTRDM